MKKYILWGIVIALCSCVNEGNLESPKTATTPKYLSVSLEEIDTRTYVENKSTLHWSENDEISYFPGTTNNVQYRFMGDEGAVNGLFERVGAEVIGGAALTCNYAVYPYSASSNIASDGTISYNMPTTQYYKEQSFGVGSNVMVSTSNDKSAEELKFKNVCGYLTLQLYGENTTVKSVYLRGNDGEKIAGLATIRALADGVPTIEMSESATCELTIDCGSGLLIGDTQESATTFWFVLPTIEFSKGFTVTVTDTNGGVFEKSTTNSYKIDRNMIQPMKALSVLCERVKPANNEIWYTAIQSVHPYETSSRMDIKSNVFDSATGKGVITFKNDVTTVISKAFYRRDVLKTVTLPECVKRIESEAFRQCENLTKIVLPESLTEIGAYAIAYCPLNEIIIPQGIQSIGDYAFYGANATKVVIPNGVSGIGSFAFSGVGGELFVDCDLRDGNATSITGIFRDAAFTKAVIGENVTTIGARTFQGCGNLAEVHIGENVSSIKSMAFVGCHIETMKLGKKVSFVAYDTFGSTHSEQASSAIDKLYIEDLSAWCRIDFESKNIKNDWTGNYVWTHSAFTEEADLYLNGKIVEELIIPSDITEIKKVAFYGCTSLQSVILHENIASIAKMAFNSCPKLTTVYCKSTTPPTLDSTDVFSSTIKKIYVPLDSVEDYKSAQNWESFAKKIEGYNFEN